MSASRFTIAVIAPGAMGSAVARRLVSRGARVLTSTQGRSADTVKRALDAGMIDATDEEIVEADLILSIVPPADALALARRLSGPLSRSARRPIYVDCNAVNVVTVEQIAGVITATGTRFVDAGIIGAPPKADSKGPAFHFSGADAGELSVLREYGIDTHIIDGPVGAASALKMCFAGISKGLTGIAALMVITATRVGAESALRGELAESLPQVLSRLDVALPDMVPKAYRWVAEMREIAAFIGRDDPASAIYEGLASLFEQIEKSAGSQGDSIQALLSFPEKRA